MIEDKQHMNQKMIHQIRHENLGKRKICRKSVTHCLAREQKTAKSQLVKLNPDLSD
jgi:hypothetical protein